MKTKKSLLKRVLIYSTIALVTVANLFTIGFSAFIISGGSAINGNNFDVIVSDLALINVDKNNANSPDKNGFSQLKCSHNGFTDTGESLPTSKVSLYFNLTFNASAIFDLHFTFKQITTDTKYSSFDLIKYVNKMSLNATVNTLVKTKTVDIGSADRLTRSVTKSFTTEEVGIIFNRGVVIPMSVDFYFDTTGIDFGQNIFLPLYKSNSNFEVEIKINEKK